jgi:hypothetical protein
VPASREGKARARKEVPAKGRQGDPKVVALIDKLTEVADEGAGAHSTAWVSGFIAVDEDLQFAGGMLGSRKPVVSSPMRELVRLGVAALPDLLDHLSDPRPTKLAVGRGGFASPTWHSDEYDPRYGDPRRHPPGVNSPRKRMKDTRYVDGAYTVKVGDLCYVAVGQIVNRGLSAVRYQPTLCLVINSPVETPALAAAVRRDWAGLTREQHKQSLSEDACDKYPDATSTALRRLHFYYPEATEPLALKLLARPWYDDDKLGQFLMERLVKEKSPEQWKALIAAYAAENGQAAVAAIPFRLHWIYLRRPRNWYGFANGKATAIKVLAALYPQYDPNRPAFINAASTEELTDLIWGLSNVRSQEVDKAVTTLFRSVGAMPNRDAADSLGWACLERLIGKGLDKELAAYCEKRIQELTRTPRKVGEDDPADDYRQMLRRIKKRG